MKGSEEVEPLEIGERGWIALLPAVDRARILERCLVRKPERGVVLYRLGDPPDGLYYLASGCIRMDTVQSDHGPTMLSHFHAGSWLGEVELFSRMPRLTTLTVIRSATILFLPLAVIESLSKERPEIWRALGQLAAEHVALAVAALDDLTIRASDARVAAVLLRLCGARVEADPAGMSTELDVTQHELAQMANLSRSITGDLLRELEERKILSRRYGRLVVLDVPALKGMLEVDSPDAAK